MPNAPFLEDFEKPKDTFSNVHAQEDGLVHDVEEILDREEADGVKEAEAPSLKMSKAELVAFAEDREVEVVLDTMTKAEILDAIEKAE